MCINKLSPCNPRPHTQNNITDLAYARIKGMSIAGTNSSFTGEVHYGFSSVFQHLWPAVRAALQEQVVDARQRDGGAAAAAVPQITFAGHSLGAGAATLLSYATVEFLKQRGIETPVSAILFGAPNTGDSVFVEAQRQRVNTRRLTFDNDVVPLIPCASGMPACGSTPVRTNQFGAKDAWSDYQPLHGSVTFGSASMPLQQEAWAKTRTIRTETASVSHGCSYSCKLSAYSAGPQDSHCLLLPVESSAAASQAHSYCPGFPQNARLFMKSLHTSLSDKLNNE